MLKVWILDPPRPRPSFFPPRAAFLLSSEFQTTRCRGPKIDDIFIESWLIIIFFFNVIVLLFEVGHLDDLLITDHLTLPTTAWPMQWSMNENIEKNEPTFNDVIFYNSTPPQIPFPSGLTFLGLSWSSTELTVAGNFQGFLNSLLLAEFQLSCCCTKVKLFDKKLCSSSSSYYFDLSLYKSPLSF